MPTDQTVCHWHIDADAIWQGSCGVRAFAQLVKTDQVVFCMLCGKPVRLEPAEGKKT